jgi:FkbM family methyltransferase
VITFDQWYLPDGETHLQSWMTQVNRRVDGRLTYQYHKYEAAVAWCKQRRTAVDVGAHVGLWSYWMSADFNHLEAFEPHPDHVQCWLINMMGRRGKATLHECALGDHSGTIQLTTGPSSSGDTYVVPEKDGNIRLSKLDELGLMDVDFLKVDCEGYEVFVLRGAQETIERCRPVVIVEQKPKHGDKYRIADTAGAEWLKTLGYRLKQVISGDYIMLPPEVS